MAVERMVRVRLFAHREEIGRLAAALQDRGCLHPISAAETTESPDDRPRERAARAAAFLAGQGSRSLLAQFFRPRRPVGPEEEAQALASETAAVMDRAVELEKEIARLRHRREVLVGTRGLVLPFRGLGVSQPQLAALSTVGSRAIRVPRSGRRLLEQRAASSDIPTVILPFAPHEGKETLLLLFPRPEGVGVDSLLDGLDVEPVDLDFLAEPPEEMLAGIDRELTLIEQEIADAEGIRESLASHRPAVELRHDIEQSAVARRAVIAGGERTQTVVCLDGWVPEPEAPGLARTLEEQFPTVVLQAMPPGAEETPPVRLANNRALRPFEVVTELFGRPQPAELDPTPLLAPFFIVFFGLCLTDAAYGLVLALLSLSLLIWGRRRGVDGRLFRLMIYGGFSTFVLGALTGGWFGDIQHRLPGALAPVGRLLDAVVVFSPLDEPMTFMILSLALGFLQIQTGLAVKMIGLLRSGSVSEALFSALPWFLLIPSLVAWAASAFTPAALPLAPAAKLLAAASAATIVLYGGPGIRNPFARIGTGLYALYGISGFLGDLLSYLRLVALGLATGVIGMVINLLAGMLAGMGVIGFLPALVLMVAGHLFNLAINLLGAFIHTSRLQYVEFFPKFFRGGGVAFSPLAHDGRFTFKPTAAEGGS